MIYSSFPYVLWPRPKDYGVVIPNASGMLQNAKALLEMGEKSWNVPHGKSLGKAHGNPLSLFKVTLW